MSEPEVPGAATADIYVFRGFPVLVFLWNCVVQLEAACCSAMAVSRPLMSLSALTVPLGKKLKRKQWRTGPCEPGF